MLRNVSLIGPALGSVPKPRPDGPDKGQPAGEIGISMRWRARQGVEVHLEKGSARRGSNQAIRSGTALARCCLAGTASIIHRFAASERDGDVEEI